MKKQQRGIVLIGGLVVLLLALVAGAVWAQTATPEAPAEDEATPADTPLLGRPGRGLFGFDHRGRDGSGDRDEYLADALGITTEALQAAREEAFRAAIADAVADGLITQAQADKLLARQALKAYVSRTALLAEALGMTSEELEAALEGGQSLPNLLTERDMTAGELQTAARAAYEAAIARAVADGVITQAQADEILSAEPGFGLFGGHGGRGGHGRHGFSLPDTEDTTPATPETDA